MIVYNEVDGKEIKLKDILGNVIDRSDLVLVQTKISNQEFAILAQTRNLTKEVRRAIYELRIKVIEFKAENPVVSCVLVDANNNAGVGISLCSELDDFDMDYGKIKAAGRAIKGLVNRCNSELIRDDWNSFPNSWTKRRIVQLQMHGNMYLYKVGFIKGDDQDDDEFDWCDRINKQLAKTI